MTLYRVTGDQRYRGRDPGEVFVGQLEPQVEGRAIGRGNIEIVEHRRIVLDGTRCTLPRGWSQNEPPDGLLLDTNTLGSQREPFSLKGAS